MFGGVSHKIKETQRVNKEVSGDLQEMPEEIFFTHYMNFCLFAVFKEVAIFQLRHLILRSLWHIAMHKQMLSLFTY